MRLLPAIALVLACAATPASAAPLSQTAAVKQVTREVDLARRGRMAEAERNLSSRLASLRSGEARADLLEAFGIGLYAAAPGLDHAMTAKAIDYLGRAVDAYEQARGNDDPEVATALVRRAELERLVRSQEPQAWVDADYQRAYRIRRTRLGAGSLTTLSTLIPIAELMVLPSRSKGDGTSVEAAASLLRQVIEGASQSQDASAARLRSDAFDAIQRLQLLYGANPGTPNPRISGATIQPCRDRINDDALVFVGNADSLEMLAARFRRAKLSLVSCGSAMVFELSPGVDPSPVMGLLTDIASGKIRGVHMGLAEER